MVPPIDPGDRRGPTLVTSIPLSGLRWRHAAMLSIAGHVLFVLLMVSSKPLQGSASDVMVMIVVPLALGITPSVRVLRERRRHKYVDVLHWIWVAFWLLMIFVSLDAPARDIFTVLVFDVSLILGVAASVAFLLRKTTTRSGT